MSIPELSRACNAWTFPLQQAVTAFSSAEIAGCVVKEAHVN